MSRPCIVGDIGGTHARLALADVALALTDVRDYASAEFVGGARLIERYRREVGIPGTLRDAASPSRDPSSTAAAN